MLAARIVRPAGTWPGPPDDTVVLDHDARHRRRLALTAAAGTRFLLDLPRARVLRDGDGLMLEDGRMVAVRAAPETLLEVEADDPHHLLRLAWHLGNRHLPTMILDGRLRIRDDHVIADLCRGLGARVRVVEAPFDPEAGAYAEGGDHTHPHPHNDHRHDHGHRQR